MIDPDRIHELIEELGSEDFGEIVEVFLEELDDAIAGFDGMAAEPDEAISRAAHFITGSAANLGLSSVAALCSALEGDIRAGQSVDGAARLSAIKDQYFEDRAAFLEFANAA